MPERLLQLTPRRKELSSVARTAYFQPLLPMELFIIDDVLFKGTRMVIPKALQNNRLKGCMKVIWGLKERKRRPETFYTFLKRIATLKKIKIIRTCQKYRASQVVIVAQEKIVPWSDTGVDLFTLARGKTLLHICARQLVSRP